MSLYVFLVDARVTSCVCHDSSSVSPCMITPFLCTYRYKKLEDALSFVPPYSDPVFLNDFAPMGTMKFSLFYRKLVVITIFVSPYSHNTYHPKIKLSHLPHTKT